MANTDIENYINSINKNNKVGRKRDRNQYDNVVAELKETAVERLLQTKDNLLYTKGKTLTVFITKLKSIFKQVITGLKNDKQIESIITDNIKLQLIAELTVCNNLLDDINKYALKNLSKTFKECIMHFQTNKSNKRNTSQFDFKLDYEEEESDETSDEEYFPEEEEEDVEEDVGDESHEFFNQIYKTKSDDREIITKYFTKLSSKEKKLAMTNIKQINDYHSDDKPILFQIMDLPLSMMQKNHILTTYNTLINSHHPETKLKNWFDALMTIPFGKYKGINLKSMNQKKVKPFLDNLQTIMDTAVYGHDEAKRQIIQMMGQQIRNPTSKGSVLGIWGPPGNGKTSLVKEGIAKAMNKPFVFISLGGATDSSFLEGHSYTYEGSIYGRIANGLITSKCMDPIIYFDELDKISKTHKGDEITNMLIHLTDPAQNSHFRDKYFHGIDIDLSRATMIFSFNDPSNVNHILLDRITTVETKHLLTNQKVHIANNYLLPEMMKDMGLKPNDINMNDETLKDIISKYTHEGGVRKLKSVLYNIVRELNLSNLVKTDNVVFPYTVEISQLKKLLKHKMEIEPEFIDTLDKSGFINGLYATSDGSFGGVMPIQILWVPTSRPLEVKTTGNLHKVIKESMHVASTLAFNYLPKEEQEKLLNELKERPKGLHIHCPEGATPKDGPSAGTALTVAVYSLLINKKIRHDVAITGEINLQGKVTAIGGLENKLEGAKIAGVKLVLYPKENQKHIDKIMERNPTLFDDNFKVVSIETVDDALKYCLV
jgi:ATP-dependent Lon protease